MQSCLCIDISRIDRKIQNSNLGAKRASLRSADHTPSTMLWVDKYRPNSLSKLDVNSQLTERLKAMVSEMQILLRLMHEISLLLQP
jgi:hypothetical protein